MKIVSLGGGVTALANVGTVPNAKGASISGSTLTLQPADGTFPGVVSASQQHFKGGKIFDDYVATPAIRDGGLVQFLDCTGRSIYDASSNKIFDAINFLIGAGLPSNTMINLGTYKINANANAEAIDVGNYCLKFNGHTKVDWANSLLKSAAFSADVYDFENYLFKDSSSQTSGNHNTRDLITTGGFSWANWNTGMINYINTNNPSIDTNGGYLYDPAGFLSIGFSGHTAHDGASVLSLNYGNRSACDVVGNPVITWNGTQALGFFGGSAVTQPTSSGAQTANILYGATEQAMIQQVYDAVRALGLMS